MPGKLTVQTICIRATTAALLEAALNVQLVNIPINQIQDIKFSTSQQAATTYHSALIIYTPAL